MLLVTLRNLFLSYGPNEVLLENAQLTIETKERICLIGRNGAGKSSLLKIIQGDLQPDSGDIERIPNLKISKLIQEIPRDLKGTVFEVVASALKGCDLADWDIDYRVESILDKMDLDPQQEVCNLSGGYIRRVLMAAAIVSEPDILLLDEPTNHLDIDTIAWLEDFLLKYPKTILFITHDRVLLDKIATRIIEIDDGQLVSWKGNYTDYLVHKEAQLSALSKKNDLFDKKLAEEERWIRQGIKARRTRNEGRVRALEAMRVQRQNRRSRVGTVNIQAQSFDQSGKSVFDLDKVHYAVNEKTIIKEFSSSVMRGDKIGIIGANGCGKSTLLRIVLKQLEPISGKSKHGTQLNISYFDQQREQLDDEKMVIDNISDGCDFVTINGKNVHIMTYLNDFLFTPQRARVPVKVLSGGERHRLLLARLFTRPSNVLILDEPTNDLDAETLELLAERLSDYEGTLLLVSHDRSFLNNIVTSTWVFEGDGEVNEYIGGYDDYLRQRKEQRQANNTKKAEKQEPKRTDPVKTTPPKRSHKEKMEMENLLKQIEKKEKELEALYLVMAAESFAKQGKDDNKKVLEKVAQLEKEIKASYQLWESMDGAV
ncbi:MAG: ATP-binding cassette domain-containing protein [Pseudomonadota bacterium]